MKFVVSNTKTQLDKLNAMRAFAKVAESGNFSSAARLLGRSKAVVSKQIAMLEASLGVQLLVRTTRQVRLTEVGRRYQERCAQVLAELDDSESNVQQSQGITARRAARGRAADLRRAASVGGQRREFCSAFPS